MHLWHQKSALHTQVGLRAAQRNATSSAAGIPGYARHRLCNSDPLRGNFIAATASWGGGSARALPGGGHAVQLEVILVAAKLFSLQFKCTA